MYASPQTTLGYAEPQNADHSSESAFLLEKWSAARLIACYVASSRGLISVTPAMQLNVNLRM